MSSADAKSTAIVVSRLVTNQCGQVAFPFDVKILDAVTTCLNPRDGTTLSSDMYIYSTTTGAQYCLPQACHSCLTSARYSIPTSKRHQTITSILVRSSCTLHITTPAVARIVLCHQAHATTSCTQHNPPELCEVCK